MSAKNKGGFGGLVPKVVKTGVPVCVIGGFIAWPYLFGSGGLFGPSEEEINQAVYDAMDNAYAFTEIDMGYIKHGDNGAFVCFENPTSRDDLFDCRQKVVNLTLDVKGVLLECGARVEGSSMLLGNVTVKMSCVAPDGPQQGLPEDYSLKNISPISSINFDGFLNTLLAPTDEPHYYLEPVTFSAEPNGDVNSD